MPTCTARASPRSSGSGPTWATARSSSSPSGTDVANGDGTKVREDYCRSELLAVRTQAKIEAAEAAYRADHGLPAPEDEPNAYDDLPEDATEADWAAAGERQKEINEQREAQWADFEPIRLAAEHEAWDEVIDLPGESVRSEYDALREQRREETLAMVGEARDAYDEWQDEDADEEYEDYDEPEFSAFGFRDVIFLPLALFTAFGLGTGFSGND